MKIGIIGTGNMGTIITEAFINSGEVNDHNIIVTNRTIEKAFNLKNKYSNITVVKTAEEVLVADLIFICVRPLDIHPLLHKIKDSLTKDKCIVSITSPIKVPQLEAIVPCSVARVIPSITNRALAGVTLLTFGKQCSKNWKTKINNLFSAISVPLEIDEEITRVSSDIVSCGPALYSYLTQRFVSAAVRETKITEEKATKLAAEMLIGLGELLKQEHYTLPTLQQKVCVRGGITGEAIKVLEAELGEVFENVFKATHNKFAEDIRLIGEQFNS